MGSIVIALPKIEDAKKIRTVLINHSLSVSAVCHTASGALSSISELDEGILICSCRLPDMYYTELRDSLPRGFEMLLLASGKYAAGADQSVLTVAMPIKVSDLLNTVQMVLMQQERRYKKKKAKPRQRTWREQNYISNAKFMLMQRNHLSEEEAYRYIQKCSMDSATNMAESAQMLLRMFYDEV